MKSFNGAATSAVAMVMALASGSAIAQTANAPATATPATQPANDGLTDIVVTAQKRSERLQDVPVAVSVATGEQLSAAGISGTRGLTYVTPGLNFTQGSAIAQPLIRGVGARNVSPGDESPVPIYIDGVYQSSQHAGFFEFNNVERIEVLKGPQGTLFGRNAVGGAINVITEDPKTTFEARAGVSYGSYNAVKADAFVNVPLGDTLALNVTGHLDRDDGYIRDIVRGGHQGGADFIGGRAKLMWRPTDNFSLLIGGTVSRNNSNAALAGRPLDGDTVGRLVNPNVVLPGSEETGTNYLPLFKVKQWGTWINAQGHFQPFDASLIVAYTDTVVDLGADSDYSSVDYTYSRYSLGDASTSAELRFTSNKPGSRLSWIGGFFLFFDTASYGKGDSLFLSRATPTGATTAFRIGLGTQSYSIFGEMTYKLTDQLSVTAGLRYSIEDRSIYSERSSTPFGRPIVEPVFVGQGSTNFSKASPRATVKYDFTPRFHGYFTYSQGFKSGVYNATQTTVPLVAVKPEVLDSFEVGLKTEPTSHLRVNVAAYLYNYTGLQISSRDPVTGGSVLQNAADAKNYGGEAEVIWAPSHAFQFNGGVAYAHARFGKFPGAQVYVPNANGIGNTLAFLDVSGNPIPRVPDWTFNLGGTYRVAVASGELAVSTNYFWSSNFYWDPAKIYDADGGYNVLNATADWTSPNKAIKLGVFVENLTDSHDYLLKAPSAPVTYGFQRRPRSFGVRASYRFN